MFLKVLHRIVIASVPLIAVVLIAAIAMAQVPTLKAVAVNTSAQANQSTQPEAIATMVQAANAAPRITINSETGVPDGAILLTVILKHDQSKTVDQILEELKQSGYWKAFPPKGVAVVSWYVVMGLGQVVTLAVPPDKLRAVNVAIERTAWKAYRTEVYPTYDFAQSAQRLRQQAVQQS